MIAEWLKSYFTEPRGGAGPIYNERSLQLELGVALRGDGFQVEFERPFRVPRLQGSTCRPKQNLDLLVKGGGVSTALELKVPLQGRHPETMYDFCADIEFVESLKRTGAVESGFCIMLTNDKAFWEDSGRGSTIHNAFRCQQSVLSGPVTKPTGLKETRVILEGTYCLANQWASVTSASLMRDARVLVVQV